MAVDMSELCRDLLDESLALERILVPLDEAGWATPTPAPGWTVREQMTHLAHFDDVSVLAVTDPEGFRELRAAAPGGTDRITGEVAERHAAMPATDVLFWFHRARARLLDVLRDTGPRRRVEWYGPEMSAASVVTARIMETWAHGQDVADALEAERGPSRALPHVAHLGVAARAFSFRAHDIDPPDDPVRVELSLPDGTVWARGEPDAADRVTGLAVDFCLLVTRRRHRADTTLEARGDVATRWLDVAQAFAGAPGSGRRPGQFERIRPPSPF
jgi:uncharacterized protein (TIGR03084 family)